MFKPTKVPLKPNFQDIKHLLTRLAQTKGWFWEARNRILAWYGLLTIAFIGLSVPIFSKLVLLQIDRRVRADLVKETATFEEFMGDRIAQSPNFNKGDLERAFQRFFFRHIPEDDK